MLRALEKIAFLPFGLIVDKWRWGVFSGQIPAGKYNEGWWSLRRIYQGIAPARPRDESFFDAGAKYHIPSNTPYSRYFLAAILQFQFHRALCKLIGHPGPLHRCSIYENKEAGKRLEQMMAMGLSKPWPEALKVLTGEDRMDASAILDYFKPLHAWLKQQNQGKTCGWKRAAVRSRTADPGAERRGRRAGDRSGPRPGPTGSGRLLRRPVLLLLRLLLLLRVVLLLVLFLVLLPALVAHGVTPFGEGQLASRGSMATKE
jgi:hypothetical protein